MRANFVAVFLFTVVAFTLHVRTNTLSQYVVQVSDAQRIESLHLSEYSFSQVFGGTNATSVAEDDARSDNEPPPPETWLLNPLSHASADPTVIPRIINKIFFQKSSGFPKAEGGSSTLTAAHESWTAMNPGYDVRYFDLDLARKYLHQHFHPVFLRAFDCLPAFAAKSDLFRFTLLYREGGWHSDWKQVCLQKYVLQNISEATDIFAAYDLFSSKDFYPHKCVQNAFVGSRPQHPIIEKGLEMILRNVQSSRYSGTALDATACCVFGRAVQESEAERKSEWFSKVAEMGTFSGVPVHGAAFSWIGKPVVKQKCHGCDSGQDWGSTGNNYILLYKQRQYYCEDAASLFSTTLDQWDSNVRTEGS